MPKPKFQFNYNDGGKPEAEIDKGHWDCVCRAISIATSTPYMEVHEGLTNFCDRMQHLYEKTLSKITLEEASDMFDMELQQKDFDLLKDIFKGDYSVEKGLSGFIVLCYMEYIGWERVVPKDTMKCYHPDLSKGSYVVSYEIDEIKIGNIVTKLSNVGHCLAMVDGVLNDNNEILARQCFIKPVLHYWKKKENK
jgi:hypothetical protein